MTNRLYIVIALIIGIVIGVAIKSHAAGAYASISLGPIAPAVGNCPKPLAGYTELCPVGSGTSFQTYVSYNGAAYQVTGW